MAPTNLERYIRSIFVQNIPAGINEETFRQILSRLGTLLHFHMFVDPTTSVNPLEKVGQTSRSYAFAEFGSVETAQKAVGQLNGLDLGGFRLFADFISKQPEAIINLFEQLCPTTTTITSTNKNDPRLANANVAVAAVAAPPPSATSTLETPAAVKEDRESISNAVASLPPAQMFELMKQMKQCIEANPNEAKTLLSTNPQLAYALLQAQVVMRIVDPQVAMALLNRTDKDVIPAPTDMKKISQSTGPAAVTAPLTLPPTTFPFPGIPGVPFTMPMIPTNPAGAQQAAAAAAFFQAAILSGVGLFPPTIPTAVPFPPHFNPMAPGLRPTTTAPTQSTPVAPPTTNLDENAALLLLQLDDAQLAQLPPAQSMQIRTLREQIAKTGLLPKMS